MKWGNRLNRHSTYEEWLVQFDGLNGIELERNTAMDLERLKSELESWSQTTDETSWPDQGVKLLTKAGCWRNAIPKIHGGYGACSLDRLKLYETVASASLTLALILTQHDGACELISDSDNEALASELLPQFASGKLLTTVGISQLTTSRRGVGPAMQAEADGESFRLSGVMPWVTSAGKAHCIVTGAAIEDGQQILACVPTSTAGFVVKEPMRLMALTDSWTSEVTCEKVLVTREHLLRGPTVKALARRAPAKPLTVSSCGLGAAGSLLAAIQERRGSLPGAGELIDKKIVKRYEAVRDRLYQAAESLNTDAQEIPATEIRLEVNDLVTRLAVSLMALLKGSGYLSSHPTQRLVREAMFFLVWSAPPSVQIGALESMWE